MELDESSGQQSSTEASQDNKGEDQSCLSVPEPFTVPPSYFKSLPEFTADGYEGLGLKKVFSGESATSSTFTQNYGKKKLL